VNGYLSGMPYLFEYKKTSLNSLPFLENTFIHSGQVFVSFGVSILSGIKTYSESKYWNIIIMKSYKLSLGYQYIITAKTFNTRR
jgi:hypothetical protein